MLKKYLLAVVVVFVALSLMDWLINSFLLMGYYEETESLWRPMEEMKWWVMYLASFISTMCFVYIYWKMIKEKSVRMGFRFGSAWGLAIGVGMGYATYSWLPIPYMLAFSWFLTALVEYSIAGLLTAMIVKE